MLILEGTDLVGKTTLAKKILADMRFTTAGYVGGHLGRLPDGFNQFWSYLDLAHRKLVQDRFHMSELVYSRVRGETECRLSKEIARLVDGYLRRLGVYTVVITASDTLLRRRYAEHAAREMYSVDQVIHANEIFASIAREEADYHFDVDFHVYLTEGYPFIEGEAFETLLRAYWKRQAVCQAVSSRHSSHWSLP